MKIRYAGLTDPGMREGINQDALEMFCQDAKGLFLVADGIGGCEDGARASRTVADFCRQWWEKNKDSELSFEEQLESLKLSLEGSSRKIWMETEKNQRCGSTVTALFINRKQYDLLWAGDSRCYKLENRWGRREKVLQMTRDDTWENWVSEDEMADAGKARENKGKLVRAAGVFPEFSCAIQQGVIERTTLFGLCTDGIYKYVNFEQKMMECGKKKRLRESLWSIKEEVYKKNAPDNFSCILIQIAL